MAKRTFPERSGPERSEKTPSKSVRSEEPVSWCFVITVKPGQSKIFLRRESPGEKEPVWILGVREPARDGLANLASVRALAEILDVSPSSIAILRGQSSRTKRIEVTGIEKSLGEARLTAATSRTPSRM